MHKNLDFSERFINAEIGKGEELILRNVLKGIIYAHCRVGQSKIVIRWLREVFSMWVVWWDLNPTGLNIAPKAWGTLFYSIDKAYTL